MRINGIGFLNEDGEFQLHRNILESFSIFDDTILFGMFYPNLEKILRSTENDSTKDSSIVDIEDDNNYPLDFIITPIPYALWNRAGRLIFRIKGTKQREAIQRITEILNQEGITILNSFSNRSAHSYSTWDVHIAFEKLDFSEYFNEESIDKYQTKNNIKLLLKDPNQIKGTLDKQIYEILENLSINITYKQHFHDEISKCVLEKYNTKRRIYTIIYIKLHILQKKLLQNKDINKLLYHSKEDSLKNPIVYRVNSALHYFHHKSIEYLKVRNRLKEAIYQEIAKNKEIDKEEGKFLVSYKLGDDMYDFIFQKFTLRYSKGFLRANNTEERNIGKLITNSKGKVSNILYLLSQYTELFNFVRDDTSLDNLANSQKKMFNIESFEDILPALTFVEADSHFLNLRIVIIPKIHIKRFVKLNIYYQRMNDPYSSKGLLFFMSEHLPQYFKIWKYHNRLFDCRDTFGSGKLSFFLEDTRTEANYELDSYTSQLETIFNQLNRKIKTITKRENLNQLKDFVFRCKVEPMANLLRRNFEAKQNSVSNEYDVFISYASQNEKEAERIKNTLETKGLSCYMSSKNLDGGDGFSDKIKTALQSSRELCLLYTPISKRSSWVTTEWGAAWALNKRITPVLLDLSYEDILPEHDRIKVLQYIKYRDDELIEYAQSVLSRRFFPYE